LYLAFNAVHTPMQATDDRLAKFPNIDNKKRRTYDAMTLALDEAVGKVRQRLAELKLEQDTLVLFISDNGGPTMPGTTINGSRNAPLRGSKRTTLEGGIRVPYVLSWPGQLKPGVYQQPVIQLDATATALAVAGVESKPAWQLDGVNLIPFLTERTSTPPHEALYWRFGNQMAIRAGDFKLVRYDLNADTLTGGRKQKVTPPRLYNLAEDIGESKDLAATMPERVKDLQARWDAWNATLVKPLWNSDSTDDDGAEPGAPAMKGRKAVKAGKS
jgi:arylsulfatase A-like enzyme